MLRFFKVARINVDAVTLVPCDETLNLNAAIRHAARAQAPARTALVIADLPAKARTDSLYLPCTFPVPSLYLHRRPTRQGAHGLGPRLRQAHAKLRRRPAPGAAGAGATHPTRPCHHRKFCGYA
jgi:hypothetical protein